MKAWLFKYLKYTYSLIQIGRRIKAFLWDLILIFAIEWKNVHHRVLWWTFFVLWNGIFGCPCASRPNGPFLFAFNKAHSGRKVPADIRQGCVRRFYCRSDTFPNIFCMPFQATALEGQFLPAMPLVSDGSAPWPKPYKPQGVLPDCADRLIAERGK